MIDFYCPELKLTIEVDGSTHFTEGAPEYDQKRQLFLKSKGVYFLRFTNQQAYQIGNSEAGGSTKNPPH